LFTPDDLLYVIIACSSGEAQTRRERKRDAHLRPQTELGKQLWAARARILAEGGANLDWEGVEREVRERRGERAAAGDEAGA
jgi:hypothetical protein